MNAKEWLEKEAATRSFGQNLRHLIPDLMKEIATQNAAHPVPGKMLNASAKGMKASLMLSGAIGELALPHVQAGGVTAQTAVGSVKSVKSGFPRTQAAFREYVESLKELKAAIQGKPTETAMEKLTHDRRIAAFLEGYEEEMEKVAGMPRALMQEGVGGAYGAAKRGLMSEGRAVARMPGARMAGDIHSRNTMRNIPKGTAMNDHPAAVEAYNKMRAGGTNQSAQAWNLNQAPGKNPISWQAENARTDASKTISKALDNFRGIKAGYAQRGMSNVSGVTDAKERAVRTITDARARRTQGIAEQSVYDAARGQ